MTIVAAKDLSFNGKEFIRHDTNPPEPVKMVSLVLLDEFVTIQKERGPLLFQQHGFRIGNTKEEFDQD